MSATRVAFRPLLALFLLGLLWGYKLGGDEGRFVRHRNALVWCHSNHCARLIFDSAITHHGQTHCAAAT